MLSFPFVCPPAAVSPMASPTAATPTTAPSSSVASVPVVTLGNDGKIGSDDTFAVEYFKGFLRIPTISHEGPKGISLVGIAYLQKYCNDMGLTTRIVECTPGYPMLIATIVGTNPSLPSILLNSHFDVVPAQLDKWSVDPWAAIERDGWIYGRGTQDMKCVCIQYLLALARLIKSGKRFARTIHLSFMPDEEIGGAKGMGKFVDTKEFKDMMVGFALDEGLASPTNKFTVFYGERGVWWLMVKSTGPTGHGSRFVKGTAMGKLMTVVNRFLEFRAEQEKLLDEHDGCKHAIAKLLGDVISVNLTALRGGVTTDGGQTFALNVIPNEAVAGFDIRIPPDVDVVKFEENLLKAWTREEGVTYEFVYKTTKNEVTSLDRNTNKLWGVFQDTAAELKMELETQIFPAGTDSRYLRGIGIPVMGFSPMNNTPILLHDHDERLEKSVFLKGIIIYEGLIAALANNTDA